MPDGFGDERREWVKKGEDLFESGLEERDIFPEFFAFEEPVGVFIPDKIIK